MLIFLIKMMIAVTAFFLAAIYLKQFINIAYTLIAAPPFGFKCSKVSLFGTVFNKRENGWSKCSGSFSPLCSAVTVNDLKKPLSHEQRDRNGKVFELLRRVVMAAVSGLLFYAVHGCFLDSVMLKDSVPHVFLTWLAVGMCWHTAVSFVIYGYVYGYSMKRLSGYFESKRRMLVDGSSFEELDLLPVEQLPYKDCTATEKMMYYGLYVSYLLSADRIDELTVPIHEMTGYYMNREYMVEETFGYYALIFYYSRYELSPHLAAHFLDKARGTLFSDTDANAKRVLAYYAFGVELDFAKSRQLLNEAYAVIDKFSVGAERELERKLLGELDGFLKEKGF